MHIELTELLRCPDCGPAHGLVAFVEEMSDRRILEGHLDCPVCERRHPIAGGVLRLEGAPGAEPAPTGDPVARLDAEAAALAGALLGPPSGPEALLLVGPAAAIAPAVAAGRPAAAILTLGPVPGGPADRVYPIVDPAAGTPPIRPGRLDGIVLAGAPGDTLGRFVPLLRPGTRIVVLAPNGTPEPSSEVPLEPLAADERAWVAERA